MITKKQKWIIIIILFVVMIGFAFIFRLYIKNCYISLKYKSELSKQVKIMLLQLSKENKSDIIRLSTQEDIVVRQLTKIAPALKQLNINTLEMSFMDLRKRNGDELFYTSFYFENNKDISINIRLRYENGKFIIAYLSVSEYFYNHYIHKGKGYVYF